MKQRVILKLNEKFQHSSMNRFCRRSIFLVNFMQQSTAPLTAEKDYDQVKIPDLK